MTLVFDEPGEVVAPPWSEGVERISARLRESPLDAWLVGNELPRVVGDIMSTVVVPTDSPWTQPSRGSQSGIPGQIAVVDGSKRHVRSRAEAERTDLVSAPIVLGVALDKWSWSEVLQKVAYRSGIVDRSTSAVVLITSRWLPEEWEHHREAYEELPARVMVSLIGPDYRLVEVL